MAIILGRVMVRLIVESGVAWGSMEHLLTVHHVAHRAVWTIRPTWSPMRREYCKEKKYMYILFYLA